MAALRVFLFLRRSGYPLRHALQRALKHAARH
jgi:hypothetical protein